MTDREIELIKACTNAGTFGLNVLILIGLFILVNRWAGAMVAALREVAASFATLAEKVDAIAIKEKKKP